MDWVTSRVQSDKNIGIAFKWQGLYVPLFCYMFLCLRWLFLVM